MTSMFALLVLSLAHAAATPADVPECTDANLVGHVQERTAVDAHRLAPLPAIVYRDGASPDQFWGVTATLRIDVDGRVVCGRLKDWAGEPVALNEQRRAWLANLAGARYRPFPDGPALIREAVREVRAVESVSQPPVVSLDQVVIRLERSRCYGTCPSYVVEIRGDGQVIYNGRDYVEAKGERRYRIPVDKVARLVDSLRAKQLWSMESRYAARVTDFPTYKLTLQLGDDTHTIVDYAGSMVGMPVEVDAFEAEVDAAAGLPSSGSAP